MLTRAFTVLSQATRRPRLKFSASSHTRAASGGLTGPLPTYGPVGVPRVLESESESGSSTSTTSTSISADSTLFTKEFSLADRVALVYCVDLPKRPGEEWAKVRDSVGTLEYISQDVTGQEAMWKIGERIGDREGRMDVCVAAAGTLSPGGNTSALDYSGELFQSVMSVNANGVLFTAQAAGKQMLRFGNGGSIVLLASICGSVALEPHVCDIAYHSSKGAILQMTRSMACELGSHRIRVNSISPGFIKTSMTAFLEDPALAERYTGANPLGRIGRPDELRGVLAWLASDASSFCTGSK
ncbi:sorbose reductase sou1 [Ganoderma leucocontextum]|nr:sorbose reductase sou1 [Ganoderma leucocontextum]